MDNIPVAGIEEIAFEVKDLSRSIAFYQAVIGLSLFREVQSKPGFGSASNGSLCSRRIASAAASISPCASHRKMPSGPGVR
jgi:catechol-2,3-dioxygenase